MDRGTVHMILHFAVPLVFAFGLFRNRWRFAFLLATSWMCHLARVTTLLFQSGARSLTYHLNFPFELRLEV